MKTFIWERLENLTLQYHPEGGLVVVADDYQKAWNNYRDDGVIKTLPEPDYVFDVVNNDVEKVFVFRDTGCC